MNKELEVIINSIPTAVLLGTPLRTADNKIYDVKIDFANEAFKSIAQGKDFTGTHLSNIEKVFFPASNLFYDANSSQSAFSIKDKIYYSPKLDSWFKINLTFHSDLDTVILSLTDIASDKNFTAKLKTTLMTDTLTGLPNRAAVLPYLEKTIEKDMENKKCTAILCLDIDNLKNINDSLGEKEGDALIIRVANILLQFKSDNIQVFRHGGDEFIVVISNLKDEFDVACITDEIYELFLYKKVKVSGGISVFPVHTSKKEELMRFADMALSVAKKNGKNNFAYFEPFMQQNFIRHLTLESKMASALIESSFKQVYQPQFDIHTGKLRGFEALIRWQDKDLGEISPSVFIPLAEESGLILSIGNWVLNTAMKTIKRWQTKFNFNGIMSVNVSPVQLSQDTFIFELNNLIQKYEIDPNLLEIEITEGVMINNMNETIDKLQALKDMGVKVSLDDFGTGYSSLNYLQMLPLNTLKIDKSFISNITSEDGVQANITTSIISMVKKMGLETIAEGVEQPEQLELLNKFECDNVQGYLRGKPMPVHLCEEYLSGNEKALITIRS